MKITKYDHSQDIQYWIEHVQQYFTYGAVTDECKQKSTILLNLSPNEYKEVQAEIFPKTFREVSVIELEEALIICFAPKVNTISVKGMSHRRNQLEHETVSEYIPELKKLAIGCKFGSNLKENLRDRLINGVKSQSLRAELLNLDDPTWEATIAILADREAAQCGNVGQDLTNNKV